MNTEVLEKCSQAHRAKNILANCSATFKNNVLEHVADSLENNIESIIAENKKDLELLKSKEGYSKAFHDRLLLTEERIKSMAEGLREIAALEDPVGEVTKMWKRPNRLQIGLTRVPIGVVGIIYEARPNVTIDAAGLAVKAGNAVILRGSSEAINSNKALVRIIQKSLTANELPAGTVALIEDPERSAVLDLMKADQYLDLLIPRGGASLINAVISNSTVPVIQTGEGNCHIYVDSSADPDMAVRIAVNAKVQRPGVCNAAETLLVHQDAAPNFLPKVIPALQEEGVEVRGCKKTLAYSSEIKEATDEDWATEYLDLILAVKVISDLDAAIDHIKHYGTGHSEAIITASYDNSRIFLNKVDAAAVYVNASTRFTDGFEFGLGAEMGISTQKLHVRGPMGLEALTSLKYIVYGSGQVK
ncbi:MAG: glutamate-5-semialdehyde dehydrogenase [Bacillota bacterium]